MKYYQFYALLLQQGWVSPAYVGVDDAGIIQYLSGEKPVAENIEFINGAVLPGFRNAHSHAFQFGMVGMAEQHQPGTQDDFWSWREVMYKCALSYNPQQLQEIATKLYKQLIKNGYTHVAEFHYLHHDENGRRYSNLAEMGERLIAAAETAGIKIALVPVLYHTGNFGQPPQPRQRRFILETVDDYFKLLDSSRQAIAYYKDATLGFGIHSLRAADATDIINTFHQGPKDLPFHLHAAEQLKEVADCTHFLGQPPVAWLLQNLPVNDRFHIVHGTHMTDEEIQMLATSGANVVLCPGTEANLGDGIFRLIDFANQNGSFSIGTDSHISLNPLEDLRWLDYAQRLVTHRRNTFADGASTLINKTFAAGCKAMGETTSEYFAVGKPLDAAIYSMMYPVLGQATLQHLLPAIIYTADSSALYGTLINGRWVYRNPSYL
jgi:formimidoylglutamate deiminase